MRMEISTDVAKILSLYGMWIRICEKTKKKSTQSKHKQVGKRKHLLSNFVMNRGHTGLGG